MGEGPHDADLGDLPPLVAAAARGERERVSELLVGGADPNESASDGWTALHAAAVFDHPTVVALLLEAGAAVDARTHYSGFTPLLNASRASANVVAALLEAGADPMAEETRLGWRPLDRFVEYGNVPAAELVLEAGADVNAVGRAGGTALIAAAEAGSSECVELLLRYGADPSLVLDDGDTAAVVAAKQGHHAVAALLEVAAKARPVAPRGTFRRTGAADCRLVAAYGSSDGDAGPSGIGL